MDGLERLEDDARPARRATWLAAGVVVLAVAALGAVRLTGVLPQPAPPTPARTPASADQQLAGWPQGIGGGTLYVLDSAGVAAVDVSSGRFQRSRLKVDPLLVRLAPAAEGVLVWFTGGEGTPRLVSTASGVAPTVGPRLGRARQVLPGPGGDVWTSERGDELDGATDTWRLLTTDDSVRATVRLTGPVEGDGAGGLFGRSSRGRVVHVVDSSLTTTWLGRVGAVGLQGWEALQCDGRRCASVLRDRASGAETPIETITTSDLGTPALSLGSRFVASLQPSATAGDDRTVVEVSVPGARRPLRTFAASEDGPSALVWLSDRWLAASGAGGLVLYDAVDDRLVTLDARVVAPTQLVLRPV